MKIRTGFVSNSSSSSFCLFGVTMQTNDLTNNKQLKKYFDEDNDERYDILEEHIGKNGLYVVTDQENECVHIGGDYSNMNDNQTYGEFKKTVKDRLVKIGINEEPEYLIGEIYN